MANQSNKIHIGTSGYSYSSFKESLYPKNLPTKKWLEYFSQKFSTVELNTTFYHLPRISTVKNWHAQASNNFLFALKANRYITHEKRLVDCQESIELFYERIEYLESKRGPVLFQLPPSFKIDKGRLIEFIRNLQKNYRHVFEFRHESWFVNEIYEILKKNNIALCISDLRGKLSPEEITADFTYIRLHGPKKAYQGSYGSKLIDWKNKIERWSSKISVFCYFDNTMDGSAVEDAKSLMEML